MDVTVVNSLFTKLKDLPLTAAANARYKAWRVERDAVSTQQRYTEDTRRRGLVVPEGLAFKAALRGRVADRATRLQWPKMLGDLHIFLAYPYHNWEAVLPEALAR